MRFGVGGGGFFRAGVSAGRGGGRAYGGVGPFHLSVGGGRSRTGAGDVFGPMFGQMFIMATIAVALFWAAAFTLPRVLLPVIGVVVLLLLNSTLWSLAEVAPGLRRRPQVSAAVLSAGLFALALWFWSWLQAWASEKATLAEGGEQDIDRIAWDGVSDGAEWTWWATLGLLIVIGAVTVLSFVSRDGAGRVFDRMERKILGQ